VTRLVALIAAGTVLALADRSTTSTLVFGDDRFLTGGGALQVRPDTTGGDGTCSPEPTEVAADLLAALAASTAYETSGKS
jgi:hypothetical protein